MRLITNQGLTPPPQPSIVLVLVVVLVLDSSPCLFEYEYEDRSLRSLRTRTIPFRHPFILPSAER
jgi:hypothetical protein